MYELCRQKEVKHGEERIGVETGELGSTTDNFNLLQL